MKRIIKIPVISISGILFLLLFTFLFVGSGALNSLILKTALSKTGNFMEGELSISKLKGNIFSHFTMEGIEIDQNNEKTISIEKAEINYHFFHILFEEINVSSIELSGVQSYLNEDTNGIWNLEKLFPADTINSGINDTVSNPFSWKINIDKIQLNSVEAFIKTKKKGTLPDYILLNTLFGFSMNSDNIEFNLNQFNLLTKNPEFAVNSLSLHFQQTGQTVSWQDFLLQLPNSTIYSEGTVPLDSVCYSQISLSAKPLNFEDFKAWIPEIYGSPEISISTKNEKEQNNINIEIKNVSQKIEINGSLAGNPEFSEYSFQLKADSIDGSFWLNGPELSSIINGELKISGSGFDIKNNSFKAEGKFEDIKYAGFELSGLSVIVLKNAGNISGNIQAGTFFGNLVSNLKIEDLFGNPNYNIEAFINHFDLSKLTGDKQYKSELNLGIQAIGEGFDLTTLNTDIQIYSKNSSIFGQPVSDFNSNILVNNGNYDLKKIRLETPFLLFTLTGKGNINEKNNLNLNIDLKNTEQIAANLGFKNTQIEGNLTGNITGPSNNLKLISELNLKHFLYDSLLIENAKAQIESRFTGSRLTWNNFADELDKFQQNFSSEKLYLKTEAQIKNAKYGDYSLSDFSLNFEKTRDTIKGTLNSKILSGDLVSDFSISNAFSEPEYSIHSKLSHFNISEVILSDSIWSDFNIEAELLGTGITSETAIAELKLLSKGSTFQNMPVSDFNATLNFQKGIYQLNGINLETPLATLKVEGEGDIKNNNNINFNFSINDFNNNAIRFNLKNMELTGGTEGSITGKPDSLHLLTSTNISDFKYDTIRVKEIHAETNVWIADSLYSGTFKFISNDLKIQELKIKEFSFDSDFNNQSANSIFSFYSSDSLRGTIRTVLIQEQNPVIYFPEIDLNIYNSKWKNNSDSGFISYGKDTIQINQFILESEESSVKANGIFSFHGNENLLLEANNFSLINIPGLQLFPYKLSGTINAKAEISGTAQQPIFTGFIDVINPAIDTLKFSKFYTSVNYSDKNLELKSYINDFSKQLLLAEAELPLNFSFSEDLNSFSKSTPVKAKIGLNDLELGRFNNFIPLKGTEMKGLLSLNSSIGNTIDSLKIEGDFNIKNASFAYQKYGVYYQNISLKSHFNNNQFILDSLQINAGNGNLNLKGTAKLESFTDLPDSFDFQLTGSNFRAFNSEILKATLDTRLNLTGTPANPVFSGNMNITKSTMNTDIFLQEYNRVYDTSQDPLLLQAMKNTNINSTFNITPKDTTQKPAPDIYKNLKGQFDITIPGNTWVKGKDMNFEIAGTLKIIKEGEQIDLFGTMNVKRGFYKLYGKRLDFEEGEITFTGGQNINPEVNFVISYKFRDPENALRKLNIKINGKVDKPEISFSIDNSEIEEKDAISYLVFNKSLTQLDTKENTTVKNSNINVAKDLAIGQVTNLVKDALQSTIGLDVIEISGQKGGTEGSVSIGKYITNNLYLNYERNFALDKKNKQIEPEKISLEYQFLKSLFLQATNQKTNSGFDFIFKWTWN